MVAGALRYFGHDCVPAGRIGQPGFICRHIKTGEPAVSAYATQFNDFLRLARRRLRSSEGWLILLAVFVGILAGATATIIAWLASAMHAILYGIGYGVPLDALSSMDFPRLIALPLGGVMMGFIVLLTRRRTRVAVDVVEANALHGGRIALSDTALVVGQTLVSNGVGASVGLEAAYAQAGGGIASLLGQLLNLRRSDMRTLVGAGAGAAIAAAFGAPLAGAFYAFEIVIGAYTPATIAAVAAACIAAIATSHALGTAPNLLVSGAGQASKLADYLLYAILGVTCALLGIGLMRMVSALEALVRRLPLPEAFRPLVGGLLLIPIGYGSPHALSSGHGALHLTIATQMALPALVFFFCLKSLASIVSLGFGFRGGLFFASLYLGALAGQIFSSALALLPGLPPTGLQNAALVGMAALAVAVVGGPMTMSLLVVEQTSNFNITLIVVTAALCSSSVVREWFGYSFSTWRLHLRGEAIKSARDIGWTRALTAQRLMRKPPATALPDMTVDAFRTAHPLSSTSRVILIDIGGHYCGIVPTRSAYADHETDAVLTVGELAILKHETVSPDVDIQTILRKFEEYGADDLVVVDANQLVLGMLTENYVRKRFTDELDQAQRELYGEGSAEAAG